MTQSFRFIKLVGLFCLSLLFLTGNLWAQDQPAYAPLIESETNSFMKIKTAKIDLIQLSSALVKVANETVDSISEDKDQTSQTKMMIAMLVPATIANFNPIVDSLKENEVEEIYIVGTNEKPEISSAYIAIPVAGKSEEQIKSLRKIVASFQKLDINLQFPFVRHGFLFAVIVNPEINDKDAIKDYIKTRFKTIESVPNPAIENVIEARPEATFSGILTINETIRTQLGELKNLLTEANQSQTNESEKIFLDFISNNWDSVINNLENYAFYADISSSDNYYIEYIVNMNSSENAQAVMDLFPQFIEKVVETTNQEELDAEQKELLKSLILTMQPNSNESSLVWRFDSAFVEKIKPLIVDYVKKMSQ